MATFSLQVPVLAGQSGLTCNVRKAKDDSLVNSTPATLTESPSGTFTGTIAEDLGGYTYIYEIIQSGSVIRRLLDDSGKATSLFGSNAPAVAAQADGGYEFTGGFADRTTGTAGASVIGSNIQYTQAMVNNDQWFRFGFDSTQQVTNDSAYWTEPAPAPTAGVGLFGGSYMPSGVTSLFDFGFNVSTYSDEVSTGDLKYTQATGSLDFSQCQAGDLALVRFDFNVLPQIANTTLEVAMIWQTRLADGTPTFTFALTGDPMFYGTGTVGRTFLARPTISAYFASNEDVNARALLAIRADNPIQIQPLTTLVTIQR
jgi:hypothetical protein